MTIEINAQEKFTTPIRRRTLALDCTHCWTFIETSLVLLHFTLYQLVEGGETRDSCLNIHELAIGTCDWISNFNKSALTWRSTHIFIYKRDADNWMRIYLPKKSRQRWVRAVDKGGFVNIYINTSISSTPIWIQAVFTSPEIRPVSRNDITPIIRQPPTCNCVITWPKIFENILFFFTSCHSGTNIRRVKPGFIYWGHKKTIKISLGKRFLPQLSYREYNTATLLLKILRHRFVLWTDLRTCTERV